MCKQMTSPSDIQDVVEFVSSSEQIWRNLASPIDPLQPMGAVKIKVQTAD